MATRGGGAGRPRLGGQYDGPFEAAAAANGGRRLPQLDGQDDEESDTEDVGRVCVAKLSNLIIFS